MQTGFCPVFGLKHATMSLSRNLFFFRNGEREERGLDMEQKSRAARLSTQDGHPLRWLLSPKRSIEIAHGMFGLWTVGFGFSFRG
jgi:hypothetical protein